MSTFKTTLALFTFILISINVISQTGPGGIGNSDGSNGQPENTLWFDASTLGLANDDAVSSWSDNSGNENNAYQITADNQPLFKTNSINGLPIIYFDKTGTPDYLSFDGNTIAGSDYTVIYVAAKRSSGNRWVMGGTTNASNRNLHFGWQSDTQFRYHHYGNDLTGVNLTTAAGGTGQDSYGIFSLLCDDDDTADDRYIYQNNLNIGQGAAPTHLTDYNGAIIGGTPQISSYSDINVAEAIFYASALNKAQLQIVHQYLNVKYDITITDDKYNPSTDFTFETAGIGNISGEKQSLASSGGLYLKEDNATLVDGDFMFLSHNEISNTVGTIQTGTNVTNVLPDGAAWGRDWYIDGIENREIILTFDFPEAFSGGLYPSDATQFALLYKANEGDDYSIVTTDASGYAEADQIEFSISGTNIKDGLYTIATTNQSENPIQGVAGRTWYALVSGDWNNWEVWTLDPSGNLPKNPSEELPSDNTIDKVVIHSGKQITVPTGFNDIENAALTVEGSIDFGTTTGHSFTTIKGTGTILLAGDNFPTGDANHFYTKGQGEGTVWYYGGNYTLSTAREFYNVTVELDNNTDIITQTADYTMNGNFTIKAGIWQINDATDDQLINLSVDKDVLIEANGKISVGTGNPIATSGYTIGGTLPGSGEYHNMYHQVKMGGNLTNNGSIRLTNQTNPIYNQLTTTGAATLSFTNLSDNTAALNGITDLYNLIIDKGTDKTYTLTVNSSDSNNFVLYGANNVGHNTSSPFSSENPEVRKALWIYHGTLKLVGNMTIPTLTEGSNNGGSGDYAVGGDAALWIASNEVTVYCTATDNATSGNTQVNDGSGSSVTTGSGSQAMSVYGSFRITDGFFGTRNSGGFIFWSSANAQIKIEGGECYVSQMRTAHGGGGIASYIQTGGTVTAFGNSPGYGEYAGDYPLFGLESEDAVFQMSGGEIILLDDDGDSDPEFQILSSEGNYSVTGGKVTIDVPDTRSVQILSTANLWDLEITNSSGSGNMTVELDTTLDVDNDLYLDNYCTLEVTDPTTGNFHDVSIGRNFSIIEGATYNFQTNTTTFDGTEDGELYIGYNTDDGYEQHINNIVVNKPVGNQILVLGDTNKEPPNASQHFNRLLHVEGYLSIISGTLNQGRQSVRLYGAVNVSANGVLGIYEAGITDITAYIMLKDDGTSGTDITTETGAEFGNLKLNPGNGNTVSISSDVHIKRIGFYSGRMNIGSNKLRVDYLHRNETLNNFARNTGNVNRMIFSDGNASDGGIEIYIPANTPDNTLFAFPLGTETDSVRYTPAEFRLTNVTDSGYIQVRPVDAELKTTDLTGGDLLDYYWRVSHSVFAAPPTIDRLLLYYDNYDIVGDTSLYVPGKVLDEDPYTRSYINNMNLVRQDLGRIQFNDDFVLENANYTAGADARFVGAPTIYYSRLSDNSSWYDRNWADNNNWSLVAHDGAANNNARASAGNYPKAGDIAVIGYDGFTGGISPRHALNINNTDVIDVAEIVFNNPSSNGNRLIIYENGTLTFGKMSGTGGTFMERPKTTSTPVINGDFGEFYNQSTFTYSYFLDSDGTYNITPSTNSFPNLRIEGSSSNKIAIFQEDIQVNYNFTVDGNTVVRTNNGANGDITVNEQLRIGGYLGGNFQFNTSQARTVEVNDIWFRGSGNSNITVLNTTPNSITHKLIVNGDITQDRPGDFDLFSGNDLTDNNVVLELSSDGTNTYTQTDGNTPEFYRVVMNKGTDQTSTFTFNNNFDLKGTTSGANVSKALELQNGTLVLNNSTINIDLSSGDDDFEIPSTACLQVSKGTVNVYGDDTGIALDGKLIVDGTGIINMVNGTGNGNNYIEYSASGTASIEIADDGELHVGGQIRRQLDTEEGILTWNQTGGDVVIGQNYSPEDDRGVFEILNTGSSFTHEAGSFTIVQAQNNPSFPAFYYNPETSTLTTGTEITIGNSNTPSNENIEMYINKSLKNLSINSSSSLTATLSTVPLTVDENLTIQTNNTFETDGMQVNIAGNFENNGTYNPNNNLTVFNGASAQEIKGSETSTFFQLTKLNSATLTLQNTIQVDDDLNISAGTINDNSYDINVLGDLYNTGTHVYGGSGDGIILNGSRTQMIDGDEGVYGKLTLDNIEGAQLTVPTDYITITNSLKLVQGRFDIGGNSLTMLKDATFIEQNTFSSTNMVQTNSSFTDTGVKKFIEANVGSYLIPIGSGEKYTPVNIIVQTNSSTTGAFVVKAANEKHPTITEDVEAPDDFEIVDEDNVLQYYWEIRATDFTDIEVDIEMFFSSDDVKITNANGSAYTTNDYIPARLLQDLEGNWNKYDWDDFKYDQNKMVFKYTNVTSDEITGDYTAGIQPSTGTRLGAIPAQVPKYISINNGDWTEAANWDTYPTSGGSVPVGGPNGAIVIIDDGHDIIIDDNYISSYATEIKSTGSINQGETFGNRLGLVSGTGTLISNTGTIPAGYYDEFFSASGGTIEYGGVNEISILSQLGTVNNLKISGLDSKNLPNTDVTVLGDLTIDGSDATLNLYNINNKTIFVKGDVIFNQGTLIPGAGTDANISLNGSTTQNIGGTKSFIGTNQFYNLEINNPSGVTISNDIEIGNKLKLTSGILNPGSHTITVTNTNPEGFEGGSETAYVNGKLSKATYAGGSFTFPVGNGTNYKPISFSLASTETNWSAEYLGGNPYGTIKNTNDGGELQSVSSIDRWALESDASASATVTLQWNAQSAIDIPDLNNMRVAKLDGSNEWFSTGEGSVTGNLTSGTVTSGPGVSFSYHEFTLGAKDYDILPIELISFTAKANANDIELNWATATETNNDFFSIERSADGINYEVIETVWGAGNSSTRIDYSETDYNPLFGTSYYRIKQTDFDGKNSYSPVVSVFWSISSNVLATELKIFPNPYKSGDLILSTDNIEPYTNIHLSIVNLNGRIILDVYLVNPSSQQINIIPMAIEELPKGMYIVSVVSGSNASRAKLIVE